MRGLFDVRKNTIIIKINLFSKYDKINKPMDDETKTAKT